MRTNEVPLPSASPPPTALGLRGRIGGGVPPGWRSALREFILIVAGVLVALAANSWWESRQDLGRERAYLLQLRRDLQATLEMLDQAVITSDESLGRLKRMEHLIHSSGDAPPTDSVLAWAPASGALRYVPAA